MVRNMNNYVGFNTRITYNSNVLTLDNISIKQYENDVCITGFCRAKKSDTLLK